MGSERSHNGQIKATNNKLSSCRTVPVILTILPPQGALKMTAPTPTQQVLTLKIR